VSGAAGPGGADRDALAVALLATHEALDAYSAAVLAAADAHPGDPDGAADDPQLESAQDAFLDAHRAFHEVSDRVLGLEQEPDDDLTDLEHDPADAVGIELYATVVGRGEGEPLLIIDAEGERVVTALEQAGFEVPEWGVRLVPVEHLDDETEDDDNA
jgi:hypothetical protein